MLAEPRHVRAHHAKALQSTGMVAASCTAESRPARKRSKGKNDHRRTDLLAIRAHVKLIIHEISHASGFAYLRPRIHEPHEMLKNAKIGKVLFLIRYIS